MKKRNYVIKLSILLAGILTGSIAFADEAHDDRYSEPGKETSDDEEKADRPPVNRVIYIPPSQDLPVPIERVVAGGTRGGKVTFPKVTLLAPDHVALTTHEQPTLYWHLSEATKLPVVLTVMQGNADAPALEQHLKGRKNRGLHTLRLADHAVHLKPGMTYEWSVCVLSEIENTFCSLKDYLTVGYVERTTVESDFMAKIARAEPLKRAQLFAKRGLWHDALGTLMDSRKSTVNQSLLEARKQLLKQVGFSTTD